MATSILVMGESGTGKSTSLRNLKAEETFLILPFEKPLPFRNRYKKARKNEETGESIGNILVSDNHNVIVEVIKRVNKNKPEIKNLIIDDFQYIMAFEFMEKANEKGYTKFTELAQHAWSIIEELNKCRDDLTCFILTHTEEKDGKYKMKTIGKMLDEKITLEGLFTLVLHTQVKEDQYLFLTQNDGTHIAKSPIGLFDSKYIDNDLQLVKTKLHEYYHSDPAGYTENILNDIPQ